MKRLEENDIVPDHQFGFNEQHVLVEQVLPVVLKIRQCIEKKEVLF